ncbi:hypothetical protein KBY96_10235 [Cyanobium sp. ATX 6A2]|nr:hypothetical protein [Cyanobium sp. ATX 6A2]
MLRPLALQLRRGPGALRPQIHALLAAHGEPLRWAITAAEGDVLFLEAVVLVPAPAAGRSPGR